jgi:hypothetical protein
MIRMRRHLYSKVSTVRRFLGNTGKDLHSENTAPAKRCVCVCVPSAARVHTFRAASTTQSGENGMSKWKALLSIVSAGKYGRTLKSLLLIIGSYTAIGPTQRNWGRSIPGGREFCLYHGTDTVPGGPRRRGLLLWAMNLTTHLNYPHTPSWNGG